MGTEPPGLPVSVLAEGAAEPDSELPAGVTPAILTLISSSEEELRGCWGKPVPEMVPVSLLQASSAWSPGDPRASREQLRAQAIAVLFPLVCTKLWAERYCEILGERGWCSGLGTRWCSWSSFRGTRGMAEEWEERPDLLPGTGVGRVFRKSVQKRGIWPCPGVGGPLSA